MQTLKWFISTPTSDFLHYWSSKGQPLSVAIAGLGCFVLSMIAINLCSKISSSIMFLGKQSRVNSVTNVPNINEVTPQHPTTSNVKPLQKRGYVCCNQTEVIKLTQLEKDSIRRLWIAFCHFTFDKRVCHRITHWLCSQKTVLIFLQRSMQFGENWRKF